MAKQDPKSKLTSFFDKLKRPVLGKSNSSRWDSTNNASNLDISLPSNVKHEWHVGFENGEFSGMPPTWEAWLKQSQIR